MIPSGGSFKEPYSSLFAQCIRGGAGVQDIHPAGQSEAETPTVRPNPAFVQRELGRVNLHQRSLCPLLEQFVGSVETILDVGCSTGGTTVAMALSPILHPRRIVGIDPNLLSIRAARIRAAGYDLSPEQVVFLQNTPGQPLPVETEAFDLTVCVSVLEFIPTSQERQKFINELKRATRPGGWIYLSTPTPFRLFEHHGHRFLGDFRRLPNHPWACPPWQLRKMFADWERIPLEAHLARQALQKLGLPPQSCRRFPPFPISALLPWQKFLFRKKPMHRQ